MHACKQETQELASYLRREKVQLVTKYLGTVVLKSAGKFFITSCPTSFPEDWSEPLSIVQRRGGLAFTLTVCRQPTVLVHSRLWAAQAKQTSCKASLNYKRLAYKMPAPHLQPSPTSSTGAYRTAAGAGFGVGEGPTVLPRPWLHWNYPLLCSCCSFLTFLQLVTYLFPSPLSYLLVGDWHPWKLLRITRLSGVLTTPPPWRLGALGHTPSPTSRAATL